MVSFNYGPGRHLLLYNPGLHENISLHLFLVKITSFLCLFWKVHRVTFSFLLPESLILTNQTQKISKTRTIVTRITESSNQIMIPAHTKICNAHLKHLTVAFHYRGHKYSLKPFSALWIELFSDVKKSWFVGKRKKICKTQIPSVQRRKKRSPIRQMVKVSLEAM